MIPHILFKLASRSRPDKFFSALDNIISNLANTNDYTILCTLDEDDTTMSNESVVMGLKLYPDNVKAIYGKSANKIHAINRDMHHVQQWDILINTSDDMQFDVKGFDDIIRNDFAGNFDQFLHYNDGNQKGNIATMSIMGRDYYNRFNYIYHPQYKSVWCDVEQTDVACILGKHRYMGDDKVIFRHMHPAWGLASYDAQYRASESLDVWGDDLQTVITRKINNYGLVGRIPKYPMSNIDNWIFELNAARKRANLEPINFKR